MSFKGEIEAQCPRGCEPFATEVWSFIRSDQSPELRDAVVCRECNLLLCPECGDPFVAAAAFVFFEPEAELLAFVFPESYRDKEDFWRRKMREDFTAMKEALGRELSLVAEPEIFFGQEELAELLESEDFRGEESEVMECVARELGLSLYRVCRSFSRKHKAPRSLPYAPGKPGEQANAQAVLAGLQRVLAANDRLSEYQAYLKRLEAEAASGLPPERR